MNIYGTTAARLTGRITGRMAGNINDRVSGSKTDSTISNITCNTAGNMTDSMAGNISGNTVGNISSNTAGRTIGIISGDNKSVNNKLKETSDKDDFKNRLVLSMNEKDKKELKEVCRQFESVMLGMVFKQMKATVIKSSITGDSTGKEIFESMLEDELVKTASEAGGSGLGDVLYRQLAHRLEKSYKLSDE